jgi:hypothetical protein
MNTGSVLGASTPLAAGGSANGGQGSTGLRKVLVGADFPRQMATPVVHGPWRSNVSPESRLKPNRYDDRDSGSAGDVGAGIQPCNIFVVLERLTGFRAGRPACPWRWIQPRLRINRPIWSRWYLTPKRRSMTSAMRAVVQGSVLYPFARAPFRNKPSNSLRWAGSSLGGRPGGVRTFSAFSPPRFQARSHRSTELAAHSMIRATWRRVHPCLRSRKAWRRRSSSKSDEPFKRAIEVLRTDPLSMASTGCCNVYTDIDTMSLKPCLQSERHGNVNFSSSIRSGKSWSTKTVGSLCSRDWPRCSVRTTGKS